MREDNLDISLQLSSPTDHREQEPCSLDTSFLSCKDFNCEILFEVGYTLEKHKVEIHLEQEEKCDCSNCAKKFESNVQFREYLVLWFKGVIWGEFLSFSHICDIYHQAVFELA